MTGRTSKADAKREEILRGAAACINEKGVRAAGIADICERLKISPGHLYYYFKSKEAIVLALLDLHRESVLDDQRRLAERPDSLDAILSPEQFDRRRLAAEGYLDAGALWELYGEAERTPGPIADKLKQHWAETQAMVRLILEDNQTRGRIRAEADLDLVLTLISMYVVTVQLADVFDPGFSQARYQTTVRMALKPYLVEAG